MKQAQLAKKLGVSDRKLRYMKSDELAACGWQKVGRGKGTFYRRISGGEDGGEDEKESMEEAKRRKLIADADIAEMKSFRRIDEIKREGLDDFMDRVMTVLRALPVAYAKARLSPEQSAIINSAYEQAIKDAEALKRVV
jgi:hypothetical protein